MQPILNNIVIDNVFLATENACGISRADVVSVGNKVTSVKPGDQVFVCNNNLYLTYNKSIDDPTRDPDISYELLYVIKENDVIGKLE